jgi:hypothetical protein
MTNTIISNSETFILRAAISDRKILKYLHNTQIYYPALKQRQAIDAKREWMRSMSWQSTRSGKSLHISALIAQMNWVYDRIDLTV